MSVCYGVQSFVMASKAPVFYACSVDMSWQTTIHACQRCPRAAMTPSAATAAIATQSNMEGTTSRFCPAGVHMGKCLAAQDLSTGVVWGSTANISPLTGGLLSKLSQNSSEQSTGPIASGHPDQWVPPNLPLPTTVHSKALFSPSVPITIQAPLAEEIPPNAKRVSSQKPQKIIPINVLDEEITLPLPMQPELSEQALSTVVETPKSEELSVIYPKSLPERVDIAEVKPVVQIAAKTVVEAPAVIHPSKPECTNDSSETATPVVPPTVPTANTTFVISPSPTPSVKPPEDSTQNLPGGPTEVVLTKRPSAVSLETPAKHELGEGKENALQVEKSRKFKSSPIDIATTADKPLPPNLHIPRFYTPMGQSKLSSKEIHLALDRVLKDILEGLDFATKVSEEENAKEPSDKKKDRDSIAPHTSDSSVPFNRFHIVTKACGCPLYWKRALFLAAGGKKDDISIPIKDILSLWRRVLETSPDPASRFLYLLTNGSSQVLLPEDFHPIIQDVVDTHPSLTFLQAAPDFHSRYVTTVVSRIFFCTNASWTGRITLGELRKSNFLEVLANLETEEDINMVTHYFSYEHFYVIYCKFWELDGDHDLTISKADLSRHNNYAISERMIDRIFSGAVTRGTSFKEGTMSYAEFVWFLLAEEDKRHPRSIEYWFRCMDLDGDGVLSLYELEHFYSEQSARMEEMGIEPPILEDCLCQCLDMVRPALDQKIRLSDLKKCNLCPIFFDTFFNLPKYLQHEQRDPFSNLRDIEEGLLEISDWDRFASDAYEMLIASEGGGVGGGGVNEDDDDDDDDEEDDGDGDGHSVPADVAVSAYNVESTPSSTEKADLPVDGSLLPWDDVENIKAN